MGQRAIFGTLTIVILRTAALAHGGLELDLPQIPNGAISIDGSEVDWFGLDTSFKFDRSRLEADNGDPFPPRDDLDVAGGGPNGRAHCSWHPCGCRAHLGSRDLHGSIERIEPARVAEESRIAVSTHRSHNRRHTALGGRVARAHWRQQHPNSPPVGRLNDSQHR